MRDSSSRVVRVVKKDMTEFNPYLNSLIEKASVKQDYEMIVFSNVLNDSISIDMSDIMFHDAITVCYSNDTHHSFMVDSTSALKDFVKKLSWSDVQVAITPEAIKKDLSGIIIALKDGLDFHYCAHNTVLGTAVICADSFGIRIDLPTKTDPRYRVFYYTEKAVGYGRITDVNNAELLDFMIGVFGVYGES